MPKRPLYPGEFTWHLDDNHDAYRRQRQEEPDAAKRQRMSNIRQQQQQNNILEEAIRSWFVLLHRDNELVITAVAGTAAIKIKGNTLHSAVGIPIEFGDNSKITMTKTSKQKIDEWREHTFLIVDEISMMDSKVMIQLNKQLGQLKNMPQKSFGGVNMLFAGDFLQLPSVSHFDLYLDKAKWRHGHDLWRSLNVVVILREQARQADDPEFAALLRRLRVHMPTDEDIDMLISRIGAPIPDDPMIPIIVRRYHMTYTPHYPPF